MDPWLIGSLAEMDGNHLRKHVQLTIAYVGSNVLADRGLRFVALAAGLSRSPCR